MNTSPLTNDLDAAPSVGSVAARSFLEVRSIQRKELLEQRSRSAEISPFDFADLLGRWPKEPKTQPDVAGELFQDFLNRSVRGESSSKSECPQQDLLKSDSLGSLFHRRDFLRSVTSVSQPEAPMLALPKIGDELFGFRTISNLGQGAFASVFLAEQMSLAGRPVVLKVSDQSGTEPQTLAQLQHTNIVPIYSVHEDNAAGIRAVCMPYFGGASLSQVLRSAWETSSRPTRGAQIVAALRVTSSQSVSAESPLRSSGRTRQDGVTSSPKEMSVRASGLEVLRDLSYSQACAWIGARLAEGLQHAHDRGVLHRDIKPSNILLGEDGTPMLLDFNLAHDDNLPAAQIEATLGGTVAYMAPEHLRALSTGSADSAKKVDQRSDIYGLGMVLFEMITGHNPFEQSASYSPMPILIEAMAAERARTIPSVRRLRDDVAWGLESVVRKCLAPDPTQRYQQAGELAEDLDRLLQDRPLKSAPELNRSEQFQKWMRRHPRLMTSAGITAVAGLLLGLSGWALIGTRARLDAARVRVAQTEAAETQQIQQQFQRGTLEALCLVNTHSGMQDHAAEGVAVCERTLSLYGILDSAQWQQNLNWQRLDAVSRTAVAEDARELLLLLAGTKTRSSSEEKAVRESLTLLERAAAIQGLAPSGALLRAQASCWRLLGDVVAATTAESQAQQLAPVTARDFYLLATTHLQTTQVDRHAQAIRELQQAVQLDPRHYWSWMQKGLCHLERSEPQQALADFGVCIGLWPEFAWGYFNRGFTFDQIGDKASAIADYSAALQRDSKLQAALHNRGMAHLELRQWAAALSDFEQFASPHSDDPVLNALRGQALEGLKRHDEADVAFGQAFANSQSLASSQRNQLLCSYGFSIYQRAPDRAQTAFEQIPNDDPKHAEAQYGLAMLATNENRLERAIELFSRALQERPTLTDARRFRAVLLARVGQVNDAIADINIALQAEPHSGPVLYAAACVTALATNHAPEAESARQAQTEAIRFLRQAIDHGYGHHAESDTDLKSIHQHPNFEKLMQNIGQLLRDRNE